VEINDELVAHVAQLARLALTPAEKAEAGGHFAKILRFVEVLDRLDTAAVDPSVFPLETHNVMADDASRPSLPNAEMLRNAPASAEGFFVVPKIVGAGAEDADGAASAAEA
jgi:aspartyl-tRNA(Asn)/glutamyl-tRNA(Gln) amidotransferase subunit C